MSERLIIRIIDASQPIYWAQVRTSDNQVMTTGTCQQLSALTEQAQTRRVVVLVDSTWLTLTSVTLPPGSRRQRDKVVPYLLEEALADEVEAVHVTLLDTQENTAQVAVVAHRQMQAWQQALDAANIHARQWIPDVLCLPWQPQTLTLAPLADQWLCRYQPHQGVVGQRAWLAFWAQAWWQQLGNQTEGARAADTESSTLSLQVYGAQDAHTESPLPIDGFPVQWQQSEPTISMLAAQSTAVSANLLSGPYRPQSQMKQRFKPLIPTAALLVMVMALLGGEQWLALRDTQQQVQVLRSQSEALFRETLPQYQRIPTRSYMVRQMDAEIARLAGQQQDSALLPWLAQLAPMLDDVPGLELQALRYQGNRDALILRAKGRDFAQFERLRGILSEHYATELGQLNRSGDAVSGEFTLRSPS